MAECGHTCSDTNSACLATEPPPSSSHRRSTWSSIRSRNCLPLYFPFPSYSSLPPAFFFPFYSTIIAYHATGHPGLSTAFLHAFLSAYTLSKPTASTSHMMKTTKRGRPFLKVFNPRFISFPHIHQWNHLLTMIGHAGPFRHPYCVS